MRLLSLLLVIKVAAGQLTLTNDVELVPAMANMAQITSLDVQCEKSGMTVNVAFSQPFNGIIFSKGHFSNPACRYLEANSGRSRFSLTIPSEGCGSQMSHQGSVSPDRKKSISRTRIVNTIIVQNDPTIQEIWDVARTIKCDWVDNFVKSVAFSPFSVGMLDAEEVAFQGDNPIECWMDLKQGKYPNTQDVDSVVKIGETLSLMVYARDNAGMYDLSVKDCYAYGGPDFDNPSTPQIQLTDSQGCVIKDKLISSFYNSRERDSKGEIIVTYAFIKAFKFPDIMDVYMSCNIEVCKGDCDNLCGTIVTEGPFRSGSTLFGEAITTLSPSTTPLCFVGSNDPRCPKPTTPRPTTPSAPRCQLGSSDPFCQLNFPQQARPSTFICRFGSKDPRCAKPTTPSPKRGKVLNTQPPPKQILETSRLTTAFTTPRPPSVTPFICTPGSLDPRCPRPTPAPPRCFPGSTDPRCPKPTTTTTTTTTTARPLCFAGSTDPRCPKPTTTVAPTTFRCVFGSKDPRCPQPTTPAPPRCFPGSNDPRCPKLTTFRPVSSTRPPCFVGSKDPSCVQSASFVKSVPATTSRPTPRPTPRPTQRPRVKPTRRPRPTTTAPPRVTPRPTPIPTTQAIREGFALFPVTQTTPRITTQRVTVPRITTPRPRPTVPSPSLKPKPAPTRKPNRGKQLVSSAPQPKPEPTGKEWEGESRYHAFHSYHFQRGDGRRSRTFGDRITRDVDSVGEESFPSKLPSGSRPLQEKVPIRLSRSLSVISPSDLPLPLDSLKEHKSTPKAEAQTSIDPLYNDPLGTVCFPMAIFTTSMLAFLFLLLLSSTAALVLYIRQRKPYKGDHVWHDHQ